MEPTVDKIKNIKGITVGYAARYGSVEGRGTTPDLAKENALANLKEYTNNNPFFLFIAEHVAVFAPSPFGWDIYIISNKGQVTSFSYGFENEKTLENLARYNIAELTWPDTEPEDIILNDRDLEKFNAYIHS